MTGLAWTIAFTTTLTLAPVAMAQPTEPVAPPGPAEVPGSEEPAPSSESLPEPLPEPVPEPVTDEPLLDIHGFISQGAFVSTANNYLGHSERGSFEFTEAAINVSREVADRLRIGMQLFTHDIGPIGDYKISLDWGFLDYRWRQWLGVRAGRVKLPFGLYNEVNDVPSGRVPILLPQSIYPTTSRDFLLALTGVLVYGAPLLGSAGSLDYQAFFGTAFLDASDSPGIIEIDQRRAAGAQVFWGPPVEGLRIGGSLLNIRLDIDAQLDQAMVDQLVMTGMVPPDFDGHLLLRLNDANLLVGSADYQWSDWVFRAEYSRWLIHTSSSVPALLPDPDQDSERFYGLASYRIDDQLEAGAYYSVVFLDVDDRQGDSRMPSHSAYQKDLSATLRYDINEFWLLKLEGHFIQGTADLPAADNPTTSVEKNWGLFLAQTVLSF